MIPNIVFAIKCKDGFENKWDNKYIEVIEQIGRFGCFSFMIINVAKTFLAGGLRKHLPYILLQMHY